MPYVLIDAERVHALEAGLVGSHRDEQGLDGAPHRAPRRTELTRQPVDRGVFATDLADRPPARPGRQQRPRPRHAVVLLGHQPTGAVGLGASPRPLAPGEFNRPAKARSVNQTHLATPVAAHDNAALTASLDPGRRLDRDLQEVSAPVGHLLDGGHVQPVQADEKITARAAQVSRAGVRRRRRLGHGRGLRFESLVAIDPLKASTPSPSTHTRESVTPTPSTKSL